MAYNIGSTVMLELRNKFSNLDKYENRFANYGGLMLFEKQTNDIGGIITGELQRNIASTFNRTVKEVVVQNAAGAVTLTSTYTCSPCTYGTATSALVTVTPVIYQVCITQSPKDFENDAYAKNFEALLIEAERLILDQMDTDAISALSTNKNQLWTNVAPAYYAQVGNVLQVPAADWDNFYDAGNSIFMEMEFLLQNQSRNIDVVMNPKHLSDVWNPYINQGAGNATNTEYQFGGYKRFITNNLPNGGGVESTIYMVKEGSVGLVDRHHYNATQGLRIHESDLWTMGELPKTGMPVAVHYQRTCNDLSTGGNGTAKDSASMVDSWTFSIERAFLTAYNSDLATRYNPIVKAEFIP